MNPALSLYLDAVRVLAACAVVLCHFGGQRVSGGLMWWMDPLGTEAVDVFFVLSGFVIASVAATREGSARDFATARMARIYAVAVPALLLTFTADHLGYAVFPAAYRTFPGVTPGHVAAWWQGLAALGFFNQAWGMDVPIGSNVPWWSLGYEVPYYAAFGLAWFGRGWFRFAAPAILLLAMGPNVLLLAPAWCAGLLVWFLRERLLRRQFAWALAGFPILAWILYEAFAWHVGRLATGVPGIRPVLPQDLLIAMLFALHLRGAMVLLQDRALPPAWLKRAITFCAGRSFSLYLFHLPILICLRAAMLRFCPDASPFWMLPVLAVCVLALAEISERRKAAWLRLFRRAWSGIG